jgi:hypothetical protein
MRSWRGVKGYGFAGKTTWALQETWCKKHAIGGWQQHSALGECRRQVELEEESDVGWSMK